MFEVGRVVAFIEVAGVQAAKALLKQADQAVDQFAKSAEKGGDKAEKLAKGLSKGAEGAEQSAKGSRKAGDAAEQLGKQADKAGEKVEQAGKQSRKAAQDQETFSQETKQAARAVDGYAEAAAEAAKANADAGTSSQQASRAVDGYAKAAEEAARANGTMGSESKQTARAVDGYAQAAQEAARRSEQLAQETKAAADAEKELGGKAQEMSSEVESAHNTVGQSAVVMGGAILAVATTAIAKYAEFAAAMSEVSATTGETASMQGKLRDAAIEAGASTSFSATEAANAITELGKAGVGTGDILTGGLSGSLALAAAGQLGVADAAEIAATTLTQFGLKGTETTHVADLLAAGAGKAQGSVGDLSGALKQSGLVASQMGLSVDETVGTLAAFASAGLVGSDAGTSFKTMLVSLANPSDEAAAAIAEFGIKTHDANGTMLPMSELAGELSTKLGKVDSATRNAALSTIFGTDAFRAAAVMVDQGQAGMEKWNGAVNDAGYAARFAAEMQNNLAGDVEKLGGSLDTAFIQTGSGANDALRALVQTLGSFIDIYSGMPAFVQQGALGLGLLAGGFALVGGGALLAIPKIVETRVALQVLAQTYPQVITGAKNAAAFMGGPWGMALAAAGIGVTLLTGYLDSLKATTEEITNSLQTASKAQDIFAVAAKGAPIETYDLSLKGLNEDLKLLEQGSKNAFAQLGVQYDTRHISRLSQILKDTGEGMADLANTNAPAAGRAFMKLAESTDGSDASLTRLINSMPAYKDALIQQASAQGLNATSSDEAANSAILLKLAQDTGAQSSEYTAGKYNEQTGAADELSLSLNELADALDKANGVQISSEEANLRYMDQLAKIKEHVDKAKAGTEGYSLSLDMNSQEGRDNYGMLLDQAKAAQDAANAQLKAGGSTTDYKNAMVAGRQTFVDNLMLFGKTKEEANRIADAVYKIPTEKEIQITAETEAAANKLEYFYRNWNGRNIVMRVSTTGAANPVVGRAGQQGPIMQAAGGIVEGTAKGAPRYFAGGGFNNPNTFSQIAAAGQTRIWNEEPAYPETFISSNPAYRERSVGVLGVTANKFGYDLVPQGQGGTAVAERPTGPQRITGTLDLGNGLIGMVEGIIDGALQNESDQAARGKRSS